MKRSRSATLIIAAASFTGSILAQETTTPSAPPRIVTISFNAAVLQTSEAQRDLGALKSKFAPRESQLQTLNAEVEALRKQLSNAADKRSESEKAAQEQSLNSKERQLQREAEDYKNDTEATFQQVFQRVAQRVYSFVQVYAKQHSYSLVIERGSDSTPVVWYVASNMDITDQVVKAYNANAGTPKADSDNRPDIGNPNLRPSDSLPSSPLPH